MPTETPARPVAPNGPSRTSAHPSCPPSNLAIDVHLATAPSARRAGSTSTAGRVVAEPLTPPPDRADQDAAGVSRHPESPSSQSDATECAEEPTSATSLTPISTTSDAPDQDAQLDVPGFQAPSPSRADDWTHYDFSSIRAVPNISSSFLRAGSRFRGTQKSEKQEYDVQVELKYVDMEQSFLCGYLRIQGLTEDHPTLTTFFQGEIIGDKFSFHTQHPEWGSNDRVDMQHWAKFGAWRPFAKPARKSDFTVRNFTQKEHLFMRWKEYFLVPDHKVRTISGASFEGFYYICFNQITGDVSGIYFHAKSEKHQKLELTHVKERGCFGAVEFR
ncbi:MAG: hypothetical protein M1815_000018 [Lichina confinis]|nr:MAG: hypothetical protein M1815_000018 [Lichina confinis]